MDDNFRSKVQARLADFRGWSNSRQLQGCRLVQYCGVERIGAIDVALEEVEPQIEGLVSEGFRVDWAEQGSRLYLRVWESAGPEPPWPKVFVEEDLIDVEGILREFEA